MCDEEDVYYLKSLVLEYENKVQLLERQLEHSRVMISQLQNTLLASTPLKKKHTPKPKTEFYMQHKNDPQIIQSIKDGLIKAGFNDLKTVPWQLIKKETDRMFIAQDK